MSPERERQIGDREAQEVEQTVGLVRDQRPAGYVEAIGRRLGQAAGPTDVTWRWNVADDPVANAFALPGGWVYVTRGLLVLANREDEIAGVVAHEMAHVIERHAASRVSAATPLAVLFGVPSGILGMVSPTLGGIVGGTGRVITGLALAPYSRDQELEADRVGVALMARAGWDPVALAAFLAALERAEALSGSEPRTSSFFATHPSTPERVANIEALARSTPRSPAAPIAAGRSALLGRLDGLVVGDNAANGVFAGALFLHADFGFALQMPPAWKTANTPEAAGAVAPGGEAAVLLHTVGSGDDPVAGARTDGLSEAEIQRLRRFQISRLPAAELLASARDGARVALTWIAYRGRIFRVTGACQASAWERYRPAFERAAASFRPLRPEDESRVVESRLRIRSARAGETVAQVVARGGGTWTPEQAAVANGVALDQRLDREWPVKVPVSERYRPGRAPAPG